MELNGLGFVWLGLIGGAGGGVSGMLGVGGGILVVPVLVMVFGFDQKLATGTSLMMICSPAALPGIWRYWKNGNVHLPAALILMGGFVFGAWIGAGLATAKWMRSEDLRTGFAFFILIMAGMMLFRGQPGLRAAARTILIVAAYG